MKKFDVIGVGALNIDYLHKVDYYVTPHEAHISESLIQAGGAAGNTICALSRLGLAAGVVGRVGIDETANLLIDSFHDFSVDFSQVTIDKYHNTGYSQVYTDNLGKRTIYTKSESNSFIEENHINLNYLAKSDWIHFSTFIDEKQFALQLWIAEKLKKRVRFSLWIDGNIPHKRYKQLKRLFPFIETVFIKEHTLTFLLNLDGVSAAKECINNGCQNVAIIQSPHESIVVTDSLIHQSRTIPQPIFDETGISCAYAAGFIFGQLHDFPLKQCAYMGNAMMSFCVEKLGSRSNLPTRAQLIQRMSLLKEEKNILIVGSGGREHALAWKLVQSQRVKRLYAAPGNYGISEIARIVPIKETDIRKLIQFVKANDIDITLVGPETPLGMGIVNAFAKEGLAVFGPTKEAAEIETSKAFAKSFMEKFHIPTAAFHVFTNYKSAVSFLQKVSFPTVIKADGLAAGKGVMVCKDKKEAETWLKRIMIEKAFGDAGKKVVIEEYLEGEEASILAITDGKHIIPLLPSQDHKRVFDDDNGLNTGGMGAYAPAPLVTPVLLEKIVRRVLTPTIEGLKQMGREYTGVLYAGIMITRHGPKVLEFNCRFGDPETQAILPLLKTDLLNIIEGVFMKTLDKIPVVWEKGSCVCVVITSGGYPENYETGKEIEGIANADYVFHSGTKAQIVTTGGRVLGIFATGENLKQAINSAYGKIEKISFAKMHYRKDIGKKGLKKKR